MSGRPRPGRAAREAALDLLRAVVRRGRPLDGELAGHAGLAALEARDRAFARLMVATALRRLGQIDRLIDRCMERPLGTGAELPRDILRLGVAQLVFLETPAHAAVGETVSLARGKAAPFRRLINAVLRRMSREGAALAAEQDAARLNTPDWLWQSWSDRFGEDACRRIAAAHLSEPPLDLTVRADPEGWANRLDGAVIGAGTVRRPPGGGTVTELAGFDEGGWWVQDIAATLPARLLISELGSGSRVADICAAPGGKTAQLAAAGFSVTAIDRSPARIARTAENLARLRLGADLVTADAAFFRTEVPFDGVLLDAPCTATGTLRRHPDIASLKGPEDPGAMAKTQGRLLRAAADLVRPGGILVYAVCSLQPEEGPAIAARFLADGQPFSRVPVRATELGGLGEAATPDGNLQTLPSHLGGSGGMDGFFALRLRRNTP